MKKIHKTIISFTILGILTFNLTACSIDEINSKFLNKIPGVSIDMENNNTEEERINVLNIRRSFSNSYTFKDYDIVTTPSVSDYTINSDFSNVINADQFSYLIENNEDFKNKMLQNGFAVTSGYNDEFFSSYETNRYNYVPNFITTDAMVHTYHLYFAHLLKTIEKDYFYSQLVTLSNTMTEESLKQYNEVKGTDFEAAALRNVAYFTVAAKLLDSNTSVDPLVADIVNQELSLIDSQAGITESPLMMWNNPSDDPIREDYTQYIVRGYYTEDEKLSAYFKTMMWYGRMSFRQSNDEETKSALLITNAMTNKQAILAWSNIYDVTSFFMGISDDPGVYDYYGYMDYVYGEKNVRDIATDNDSFELFKKEISNMRNPSINSIPIEEGKSDEEKIEAIKAFRFMGQRETFDADAFQQLIYSNILENSTAEYRMLPSAMDIPAVFGSTVAQNILREQGAYDYNKYEENMTKLQEAVPESDDPVWSASLYNGWLNMIEPLTKEKTDAGYPAFMTNDSWAKKQINTFLGGFTELKHDSVLYSKQVYAEMGGAPVDERDDRGYVEPEPELYARLANLSALTREGLKSYGMISDEDIENLTRLQELSENLLTISNKELKDELPSDEEFELIQTFGGQLEHFWYEALKDQAVDGYLRPDEHPAALVTDIATDPNGSVLEIGTGRIDNIYVLVNVGGSIRIAQGCVFSFYEFSQPINERLTDEEWRVMLGIQQKTDSDGNPIFEDNPTVEQPSWVYDFKTRN